MLPIRDSSKYTSEFPSTLETGDPTYNDTISQIKKATMATAPTTAAKAI
jgi:hypothetical protein